MQTSMSPAANQYTIISGGLRRLKINSKCQQQVVVIRDDSGSMSGDKEREATEATQALCQELALPVNKDGFWFAVVDFAETASVVHQLEKATTLVSHLRPLGAEDVGGTTNITAGIKLACELLERASGTSEGNGIRFLKPTCLLFSDGGHNEGSSPIRAADRLKALADVVSVAFGDDADEETLRQIATSDQHFARCSSGRDLRRFFAQVGATLTQTMAAGRNATMALGNLQH